MVRALFRRGRKMDRNWKIVYEDDAMLVCYKRAGLPVQSARVGMMDLESLVRRYLVRKTGNRNAYMALIHRLDQPVEGLVMFAKTKGAAAHLSKQIKEHTADKYYVTVTEGPWEQSQGQLVDYMKKDASNNRAVITGKGDEDAKEAKLEYEVLATSGSKSFLRIRLMTGRFHQIRLQMSHSGHPIVGDNKYNTVEGQMGRVFPALCAYRLCVTHPVTGERLTFDAAPTGPFFQEFLTVLE